MLRRPRRAGHAIPRCRARARLPSVRPVSPRWSCSKPESAGPVRGRRSPPRRSCCRRCRRGPPARKRSRPPCGFAAPPGRSDWSPRGPGRASRRPKTGRPRSARQRHSATPRPGRARCARPWRSAPRRRGSPHWRPRWRSRHRPRTRSGWSGNSPAGARRRWCRRCRPSRSREHRPRPQSRRWYPAARPPRRRGQPFVCLACHNCRPGGRIIERRSRGFRSRPGRAGR